MLNICKILLLVDNLPSRIVKYFSKDLKSGVFCNIFSVLQSSVFLLLVSLTAQGIWNSLPVSLKDL